MRPSWPCRTVAALVVLALVSSDAEPAGLVTGPGRVVRLPALQAFIGWDGQTEDLVVQPHFEGAAADFGLIVPTPSRPTVGAAPRDFFPELAVFTRLKRRALPTSKLLPLKEPLAADPATRHGVRVLDEALVGILDVRVLAADKPEELAGWLKDHQFQVDAADLDAYVKAKWFFTVARVDATALKKDRAGPLSPLRLTFLTERPLLPLRLARNNVAEACELLIYVQAPTKVDLPGAQTYQYQWLPMLQASRGGFPKGTFASGAELPGGGGDWLTATEKEAPALLKKGQELGFGFVKQARPQPNKQGQTATTLEYAKRLTPADLDVLQGKAPYAETVPDPDEGFTEADTRLPRRAAAIYREIERRIAQKAKERPGGYLVRPVSAVEQKKLPELTPFLRAGQFLTKLRKPLPRDEMDDLIFVPARLGPAADVSEHEEVLPAAPR